MIGLVFEYDWLVLCWLWMIVGLLIVKECVLWWYLVKGLMLGFFWVFELYLIDGCWIMYFVVGLSGGGEDVFCICIYVVVCDGFDLMIGGWIVFG